MKKTISKLTILLALLVLSIACKHDKQEDPAPAAVKKNSFIIPTGPIIPTNPTTPVDPGFSYDFNLSRLVNISTGSHYYMFVPEGNTSTIWGYRYEGALCGAFPSPEFAVRSGYKNVVPLYEYENRYNGEFFYTIDLNELGDGNGTYKKNGITAYVFANWYDNPIVLLQPVFRYWNPELRFHFYTNNPAELGTGAHGYVFEKIAYYGAKPF